MRTAYSALLKVTRDKGKGRIYLRSIACKLRCLTTRKWPVNFVSCPISESQMLKLRRPQVISLLATQPYYCQDFVWTSLQRFPSTLSACKTVELGSVATLVVLTEKQRQYSLVNRYISLANARQCSATRSTYRASSLRNVRVIYNYRRTSLPPSPVPQKPLDISLSSK